MLYQQYGEQLGIGATCHYLELGGKKIVLDCGIGFETDEKNKKTNFVAIGNYFPDEKIDLILVSHHHIDHVGAIPALARKHPDTPILMSKTAFAGADIMLHDGLKIGQRNYENARITGEDFEMIFDHSTLYNFLESRQLELIEDDCWISPWPGWKIGIHHCGHNPGARMYFISPPNDRPVILTGDISCHNQEIVKGVLLPDDNFLNGFIDQPDIVLITEGTNGTRSQKEPREKTKERFIVKTQEVRDRGGQVFCPTFASNRASNIVSMFVEAKIVPHVDGLARKMLEIELPNFSQLVADGKIVLFENGKDENRHRELVAYGEDPCGHEFSPIVSPQATLDYGFAVDHATRYLPDRKSATFFTGYIFSRSKAEELFGIRRGRTIKLVDRNGKKLPTNVRCDVHHFDFSGHDYKDGLIKRVEKIRPRNVIVHHCERRSFINLALGISSLKNRPAKVCWGKHMKEIRL